MKATRVLYVVIAAALVGVGGYFAYDRFAPCEPHSLSSWVKADERGCLQRKYVCDRLLLDELMKDEVFVKESGGQLYREITSGDTSGLFALSNFIGAVRTKHGCGPDPRFEASSSSPAQGIVNPQR